MCWNTLVWLELAATPEDKLNLGEGYPITAKVLKERMIKKARAFYSAMDFGSMQTKDEADTFAISLTELEPCIEGLIILYEQTGNESYRLAAKKLLQDMLDERWDALPRRPGKPLRPLPSLRLLRLR